MCAREIVRDSFRVCICKKRELGEQAQNAAASIHFH